MQALYRKITLFEQTENYVFLLQSLQKGNFVPHDAGFLHYQGTGEMEILYLAVLSKCKCENNLISHPQNNSRNFTFSLYYLFPTTTLLHPFSIYSELTLALSLAFSLPATD